MEYILGNADDRSINGKKKLRRNESAESEKIS